MDPCLTCVAGQELLPDDGHSAGGGGGGVEAAAVGAVGCVCAVRTSVALLAVGAPVQAPALVGCRGGGGGGGNISQWVKVRG